MTDTISPPVADAGRVNASYLAGIEWLRVAACLGIVAFHVGTPARQAALGGLQAFTALTVAFALRSARSRPFAEFARTRLRSLGLPWLFWSAVFALLLVLQALRHEAAPFGWWAPRMWLIGPVTHLWFLPFALVASLLLGAALQKRALAGLRLWLFAAIFASCLGATTRLPMPLPQWVSVLPAVVAGICLAQIPPGATESKRPLLIIGFGVVALELLLLAAGYTDAALPQLVGLGSTFVAWSSARPAGKSVLAISRLSYGVYFLHPVLIELVARLDPISSLLRWALVSAGSLLLVAGLRKTPLRSVL